MATAPIPGTDAAVVDATMHHGNAIAALHKLSFDEAWSPFTVRQVLAMPGAFGLLAVPPASSAAAVEPNPFGFALARRAADECELLSLAVLPARRGTGIGRLLLDAVIARAQTGGAGSVFLEVAEDNAIAQALYRHAGFRPVGRRPGYYRRPDGAPVAALTFALTLAP
jgi:ribosomal-protein-alanine N-acetyltransferase